MGKHDQGEKKTKARLSEHLEYNRLSQLSDFYKHWILRYTGYRLPNRYRLIGSRCIAAIELPLVGAGRGKIIEQRIVPASKSCFGVDGRFVQATRWPNNHTCVAWAI